MLLDTYKRRVQSDTSIPIADVLVGCVSNLARHRHLLRVLVWRDFSSRYRGSIAGIGWAFIVPALLVAVYTMFFAGILRVRLKPDGSALDFALFLTAGTLSWSAVNETLMRSTTLIHDYRDLIKRSLFPAYILPVVISLTSIIEQTIAIGLFTTAVVLLTDVGSFWLVSLPLILTCQWLLTLGLSWMVSAISVYIRDIKQILIPSLLIWLFLTPIFYELSSVPAEFKGIIQTNPLTPIVTSYRSIILAGEAPDLGVSACLMAVACSVALGGMLIFHRLQAGFADQM